MLDGPGVAEAFKECGITHVIWIPDSDIGTWDTALAAASEFQLIRVSREGEAIALAGGLLLGGRRPIVLIQCTGFFEAGDAIRNIVHDMKLPLFMVVGLRGHNAFQKGKTADTCPLFAEPIMQAWKIPYVILDDRHTGADLAGAYRDAQAQQRAGAVLLSE